MVALETNDSTTADHLFQENISVTLLSTQLYPDRDDNSLLACSIAKCVALLTTSSLIETNSTSLFSFSTEDSPKLTEDYPPEKLEILEEVYITNLVEEQNINT